MLYNLFENRDFVSVFAVALLAEGVDKKLEIELLVAPSSCIVALLAEAWIELDAIPMEIITSPSERYRRPPAEGVDRKIEKFSCKSLLLVALAEGVDRNAQRSSRWFRLPSPPRGGRG